MEKAIRAFIWGGPSLKWALNHVSWLKVCLPKEEGGLGLKRIGDWSKAALGARFWEVAVGSKSFWADWVSKRLWIRPQVQYLIFSGEGIAIGADPWIHGHNLLELITPLSSPTADLTNLSVAELIRQEKWHKPGWWDPNWDTVWSQITELECGGPGVDTLIWPHSISGALSTTSAWEFFRNAGAKVKWAKWIWQKYQPIKFSACAWLALQGKTPTLEQLQSKGLVRGTSCCLCQSGSESVDHLFLNCSFSAYLWAAVLRKMGAKRPRHPQLPSFLEWLDKNFPVGVPKAIMQVVFVTVIWSIWKERCQRRFYSKETHKSAVLRLISLYVQIAFQGKELREVWGSEIKKKGMMEGLNKGFKGPSRGAATRE
ncbi:hypothetical protein QJS10_CPB12g00627 [Acorus calamus]|uniref:Reverse transcriptase zinc-binding domain-containing protein n=1 Tax=Acorus calamus TaxID=4465 RepID=A0AAV9DRR0_ACOCL|nr:hypothetical protein QJS10_CPB12g00627 [Acorus calamus]